MFTPAPLSYIFLCIVNIIDIIVQINNICSINKRSLWVWRILISSICLLISEIWRHCLKIWTIWKPWILSIREKWLVNENWEFGVCGLLYEFYGLENWELSYLYFGQTKNMNLEMDTKIRYLRIENLSLYFEDLKMNLDEDSFFLFRIFFW